MSPAEFYDPRYLKRMATILLQACRQANEEGETEVAAAMRAVLDTVMQRAVARDEDRARAMAVVLLSCQRMWHIRRMQAANPDPALPLPATPDCGFQAYGNLQVRLNEVLQRA